MRLSPEQEQGVETCTDPTTRMAAVTGPAGTGKTTILKHVAEDVRANHRTVMLCAPTGKAARRITEATGLIARTIHKTLGFPMPDDRGKQFLDANGDPVPDGPPGEPRYNKRNPLPVHTLLVDEASMIGPTLWKQIMDAMPPGGVVRFFGDTNQLPPIEEGLSPFRRLLNTPNAVYLTHNYRSSDAIVGNAIRILSSRLPKRNDSFEIIYSNTPYDAAIDFLKGRKEYTTDEHQIITPQRRKGRVTTDRFNRTLQMLYNKRKGKLALLRLEKTDEPLTVKPGDKAIWVKNDYNLSLLNGDIGRIVSLDEEDGSLQMDIDNRAVLIPPEMEGKGQWGRYWYDPRKQIELGYAITTHKSQGSEFDSVVYVISGNQPYLLNRNNLYTAITRAKSKVTIITDTHGMGVSIRKVI